MQERRSADRETIMRNDSTVDVGPFEVADISRRRLAKTLVSAHGGATNPVRVFALHVGGLNRRGDGDVVRMLNGAEWVYADGAAVVLIARIAGATEIQRAPTTDLAHAVLEGLAEELGRPVRVALIGGPPGLAERAGLRLVELHGVQVVATSDGFRNEWSSLFTRLREQRPDVTFVGMGMPREAAWVDESLPQLPKGLVITCGGWFGFLAGQESRAPAIVQKYGAEWVWRVMQSPRLASRYASGLWTTAHLLLLAYRRRRSVGRRSEVEA